MTCEYTDENGVRCQNEGQPCYLENDDEEPNAYYCGDHAQGAGFCVCCGSFWGGIERFDFGNGLCEHCESEFDDGVDDEEACEFERDFEL